MFEYFSEIKSRDEVAKKKFVVVGTAISFFAIVAIWVPIRIAQWKTPNNATVAKTEEATPSATIAPSVAGDEVMRIISGNSTIKATSVPVSSAGPLFTKPMATATPADSDSLIPEKPISEVAPEVVPSPTDFPTL